MINLGTLESIKLLIAALLTYFPTVALGGYLEALVAKKMGDNTPEQFGFLTLNPLVHTDILGLGSILLAISIGLRILFGFGKYIPVNFDNITGKNRKIKILAVLFARPFANMILVFFSLAILVFFLGGLMFVVKSGTTLAASGSITASLRLICLSLISLNTLSFVIYFIVGLFRLFMLFVMPNKGNYSTGVGIMLFLLPLLMFLVLAPYINFLMSYFIVSTEKLLTVFTG